MAIERKKELKSRRKRYKTLAKMKGKLATIDSSLKATWADKLRKMTPGAEDLIKTWGLE